MADAGGRRALALVPGLPQLLAGRRLAGSAALLTWAACATVILVAPARVAAATAGGVAGWTAVAVLGLGLLGPWAWSFRDAAAGRPALPPRPALPGFSASPAAVAGLFVLGGVLLAALLAPLLAPHDPALQGSLVSERLLPPSLEHPMGTDVLARDVFSRVLWGARLSLWIAVLAVAVSVVLGTALGAVAGYAGGWTDAVIMRVVDVVLAFPRLVLLITIAAFIEPTVTLLVLALGLTQWPGTARLVRGEVLSVREREWVLAARALGYGAPRILARHVLPAVLTPVIVTATLGVGNTIVLEAGLSFLSLGPPPPTPTLGGMVDSGHDVLLDAWWLSFFPGVVIVLTVLAFNLVGDGLRDALDPRLGGSR